MNVIFIVEDNFGDAELIAETLKHIQHDLETKFFYDGDAAINFLSEIKNVENIPIGIILDINLPKKNGLEVINFIRKKNILADIPVVMLTKTEVEDDLKKVGSPHTKYIKKPIDINDLENVMTSIIGEFKEDYG